MGFFSLSETRSVSRPNGKLYSCASCGLYRDVLNARMPPYGNFKKRILNLGEAPGEVESKRNKPWQGKAGQTLNEKYRKVGIDLFEDCVNVNAICCRPTDESGNRTPTNAEINACRGRVLKAINDYNPHIIMVLGNIALQSIIGHRWQKNLGSLSKWRGWTIPDRDFNAWICPTFHPSFVMRSDNNPTVDLIWEQDLIRAFSLIDVPLPEKIQNKIKIIESEIALSNVLIQLIEAGQPVTIDFETTGLKPHKDGHRVVCLSICDSNGNAFVFDPPKTKKNNNLLARLFASEEIGKIAHNTKFEDNWARIAMKKPINGWQLDTMLTTHIYDNRNSICSLKFQTYVNFGVVDYDSEIEPYLKSGTDCGNDFNKLIEGPNNYPRDLLMTYCGWDTIYTHELAKIHNHCLNSENQINGVQVNPISEDAYKLLHDGTLAFARAERTGICIDVEYCKKVIPTLEKEITDIETAFLSSKFGKFWQHHYGNKTNINSNAQLGHLLYDVKKIKPTKLTRSEKGATDEETIQQLPIPELQTLLKARKLKKIKGTYIEGFLKEHVNGVMHPFINLHTVNTYRSSVDKVNLQNIPKRDKEAQKLCRRAILPRKGHQLLEVDYSGIEVRISCVYNKDPKLIYDVLHGDQHGDMAVEIFLLDKMDKKVPELKYLRQGTKNGFVFPQFYGDYYLNCAHNLACKWGKLPHDKRWTVNHGVPMPGKSTLGEHLINHGINSFDKFVNHIERIEDLFWNERYVAYTKWKQAWVKSYYKKGYLETLTGFVCRGVLGRNHIINYPIQGTAFHCLLLSFILLDREFEKRNLKSKLLGQIHDAILIDLFPPEKEIVFPLIRKVMCEDVRNHWDWINVPLDIEADMADIDGSWDTVKAVKI